MLGNPCPKLTEEHHLLYDIITIRGIFNISQKEKENHSLMNFVHEYSLSGSPIMTVREDLNPFLTAVSEFDASRPVGNENQYYLLVIKILPYIKNRNYDQ